MTEAAKETMPTIETMNEAIAIFMGAKIDKHNRVHGLSKKGYYRVSSLIYHSSFDALMPVYEKIKSLECTYEMGVMKNMDYHFTTIIDMKKRRQLVFVPSRDPLILVAHKAAYKFIVEHYNK